MLLVILLSPVAGQDTRGMEVCTAEKQMERRTACLQANVEFLQQALINLERETKDKIAAADRDIGAAQAEIADNRTVHKSNVGVIVVADQAPAFFDSTPKKCYDFI